MWFLVLLVAHIAIAAETSPMDLLDDKLPLTQGETFAYSVLEDNEPPVALYISADGSADFPLLGSRKIVGITPKALATSLKKDLEKDYYYTASVIIDRALPAQGRIFLSGQVAKTGSLEIPTSQVWTLSKTILSAGGFLDNADKARVALIRKDPSNPKADNRTEYDVAKMLDTGDFSSDPVVRPGDLIVVTRQDMTSRVTVAGQVMQPGVYNITRSDFTVSQAILSAGGFGKYGNDRKVKLIRQLPDGKTEVTVVNLRKVLEEGRRDLDPVVQPNDTISVPERFVNF